MERIIQITDLDIQFACDAANDVEQHFLVAPRIGNDLGLDLARYFAKYRVALLEKSETSPAMTAEEFDAWVQRRREYERTEAAKLHK